MTKNCKQLMQWIDKIALLIEEEKEEIELECDVSFLQQPDLALHLIDVFNSLDEETIENKNAYYSACLLALEGCISQCQFAQEHGNKLAKKVLDQLLSHLTKCISAGKHSLNFWVDILNVFYEAQIELTSELKSAYLNAASQGEEFEYDDELEHLETIREIILELADASDFDIAETFFAQSHAMLPDFFSGLMLDLYSIEEGQDIALLMLLHPQEEVREITRLTLDQLIEKVTLSSISLSRLQSIKNWYPQVYHSQFESWIKIQRKKGVVFAKPKMNKSVISIRASEIDGDGVQGIFIQIKENKVNYTGGLLFKENFGIKDIWFTTEMSETEFRNLKKEDIPFREVEMPYLLLLVKHFLALMINQGRTPNLHLLELQEHLGIQLQPELIDIPFTVEQLSAYIVPFTAEVMQLSFKRSGRWSKDKSFTETWFEVNPKIDKLVNRYCSFIDGVKVCNIAEAMIAVFEEVFEVRRERWLFHFLWVALWLKSKAKKREKMGDDCIMIAYAIYSGVPLNSIPLMHEICYQTVVNSIETMKERRTHLT